ncbi:hypothetical protein PALB_21420 [Pseudoalteromonas luteoviolacea B = ATCC 29581]|nr:hypothetical protein PALB_21420 [Pseudoalteromonas luteoviolacea B = ATCC 29581]
MRAGNDFISNTLHTPIKLALLLPIVFSLRFYKNLETTYILALVCLVLKTG